MTPSEYQILKESFERRLLADPKLSHAHLRVAIAIKWHMNHHSGDAWPGISTIMKLARVSRATAFRAIKYLEQASHTTVLRRPRGVNHYFPQAEGIKTESHSYETTVAQASNGWSHSYEIGGYQSYETEGCHSYETLTSEEPLKEPLPYGYDFIIPDTEEIKGRQERQGVCRESKEGEGSTPFAQPSCAEGGSTGEAVRPDDVPPLIPNVPTWKECFRVAREDFPDERYAESLVGRAWKNGAIVTDVWEKICQAKETGESLARLFWEPGDE